jgi:hypothetical protein
MDSRELTGSASAIANPVIFICSTRFVFSFLLSRGRGAPRREATYGAIITDQGDAVREPRCWRRVRHSIVAELKRERDRLSRAIAALEGPDTAAAGTKRRVAAPQAATSSKKKRAGLTPAGRKRLSEMMKKRWA